MPNHHDRQSPKPFARKRFGQHFLRDSTIIDRLIRAIGPASHEHLVEIGPGRGALTFSLIQHVKKLDVIELDRDLIPILEKAGAQYSNLVVHEADALTFDFSTLADTGESLRVVGNLPYNISTPLIFHLLQYTHCIEDMHFMLQKEVVDRMIAQPGSKTYGRLSIMVQYHCTVEGLFDVPPMAFDPPPNVHSRIVRLIPYKTLPHRAIHTDFFEGLVRTAFSHRRKTIHNALKGIIPKEAWEKFPHISPLNRPEELSVADYVLLSNTMEPLCIRHS